MANVTGDGGGSSFVAGTPAQYQGMIQAAATKCGVSTMLLSAMLKVESGFNPTAVSPAGAIGIAQFMPGTASKYGVNPWDAASSIDGMAHYVSDLQHQFGSWELAVAAYNAGPGAVSAAGNAVPNFTETQRYVENILNLIGGSWSLLGGNSGTTQPNSNPSTGTDALAAFVQQLEGGLARIALTGAGVLIAFLGIAVLLLGGVRSALHNATSE